MFCIIIGYGFGSSIYFGLPIWFESPKMKCFDANKQTYYNCEENRACEEFKKRRENEEFKVKIDREKDYQIDYSVIIDYENSKESLALEYQLVCERREIKYNCMKYVFYGLILGNVFNTTIKINSNSTRIWVLKLLLLMMAMGLMLQR